jgi:hypothetical protein
MSISFKNFNCTKMIELRTILMSIAPQNNKDLLPKVTFGRNINIKTINFQFRN